MSLKGKYALITGSSRGIGRGIAPKLAEQGVKVAINHWRNEVAANDVLGKVCGFGSDGFIVQGDVCSTEDIGGMFRRARQEFGAPDICSQCSPGSTDVLPATHGANFQSVHQAHR